LLPDLEVLVAGHHGSASSTCIELLQQTKPGTVIISVGEGNAYHHPAQETIDRLEQFGCRIMRTDQMGDITYRG